MGGNCSRIQTNHWQSQRISPRLGLPPFENLEDTSQAVEKFQEALE